MFINLDYDVHILQKLKNCDFFIKPDFDLILFYEISKSTHVPKINWKGFVNKIRDAWFGFQILFNSLMTDMISPTRLGLTSFLITSVTPG